MVQINKAMFDAKEWDPVKLKIFEGPLSNPGITSAAISGDTATITFDADGEAGDKAIGVIFDAASGAVLYGEGIPTWELSAFPLRP